MTENRCKLTEDQKELVLSALRDTQGFMEDEGDSKKRINVLKRAMEKIDKCL